MKMIIDIPEEVKDTFDKASKEDINFCYYDYNSVIGKAIKNGKPLEDLETEILEKMADYVASGYADSAEDFEEYSRIVCQTFNKHIGG